MSFVDFEPKPQPQQQPSFSDWLQEYWKQPHPQGLVAMLKAALNGIPDAVNGSIAATGAPPSTEEEAFRYNLARDRGVIGAFRAASTFGPSAPQFVGAASGRYAAGGSIPQALEGRVPAHLNGSSGSTPVTNLLPRPERTGGSPSGWPSSSGSVPSIPPPVPTVAPSGGLLGRLRELEAMERHTPITSTGLATPERDPNFRQLSRIVVRPLDAVAGAIVEQQPAPSIEPPLNPQSYSEWLAQRKKNYKASSKTSRNLGNSKKSSGDGDDYCTKRKYQEEDECSQRWEDGEFADKDHYWGCRKRAEERWLACDRNGGWPPAWELPKWGMDPDEEVYINTDR